ncbi:MAG TPA: DNA polymerase III subunit delta', partial [Polyangiaceae bacterium]|nr:DNA polymerase III subunit delta' [Polyangiaceae bacterium]
RGQAHHAYRFEGPEGVGKTACALSFAQALVCHDPTDQGCGLCRGCELARTISEESPQVPQHPDVVFVGRGIYPPNLIGRTTPEVTGISVQQIRRLILARSGFAPHEGRALCFIIHDAHELTISAANALLKTLEEPPPKTHFVLLTSQPGQLLDTIRSRTLAVRFAPLSDALVQQISGVSAEIARLAQGSVAAALELADEETHQRRQAFVDRALDAIAAPDLATAIGFANQKSEARDELKRQLEYLAHALSGQAVTQLTTNPKLAERHARQHQTVLKALANVEHNAQPTLLLEAMIAELRAV